MPEERYRPGRFDLVGNSHQLLVDLGSQSTGLRIEDYRV